MSVAIRAPRSNTKRCLRCRGTLVWSDGGRLFHSADTASLDVNRDHRHQLAETMDRQHCEKLRNSSVQ